jgi:hypothetical protein
VSNFEFEFEFEFDVFENQAAATKILTNGNASWIVKQTLLSLHGLSISAYKEIFTAPMKSKAFDRVRILGTLSLFLNRQCMRDWLKKIAFKQCPNRFEVPSSVAHFEIVESFDSRSQGIETKCRDTRGKCAKHADSTITRDVK